MRLEGRMPSSFENVAQRVRASAAGLKLVVLGRGVWCNTCGVATRCRPAMRARMCVVRDVRVGTDRDSTTLGVSAYGSVLRSGASLIAEYVKKLDVVAPLGCPEEFVREFHSDAAEERENSAESSGWPGSRGP
jgi:hypothetical protein